MTDDRLVRWGDPNQGFVGDPDGKLGPDQSDSVYAEPVARAANSAGGHVLTAGSEIKPAALYRAVLEGDPVAA